MDYSFLSKTAKDFEDIQDIGETSLIKGGPGSGKRGHKTPKKPSDNTNNHYHKEGQSGWTDSKNVTHLNFARAEEKAKKMSEVELRYQIKDCKEAITANPQGHKAGYYQDEIHVAVKELNSRKKKTGNGSKPDAPKNDKQSKKSLTEDKITVDLIKSKEFQSFLKEAKVIITNIANAEKDKDKKKVKEWHGKLDTLLHGFVGKEGMTAGESKKACPGSKINSKGKGQGLGVGQGKGPVGVPLDEKKKTLKSP